MPEEVREELRKMGVFAVSTWQAIVGTVSILAVVFISYGATQSRMAELEKKADSIRQTEIALARLEAKVDVLIEQLKKER